MDEHERRTAVIDLGSNTFRLVVFTAVPGSWWKRTDEIYDAVRIGAGQSADGALQPEPMERALVTLDAYAHFCRAIRLEDVRPVATSAIREATNREDFLRAARERTGLEVRVLTREEEAWYGYLAAANSSTLEDGVVLDIGGGSMQLTRVAGRHAEDLRSWRLGALRMTERFLDEGPATKKQLKALRAHVAEELAVAPWLPGSERIVGLGGTVRNLAAAAELERGLPSYGVQGFVLRRSALDALIDELAAIPAAERGRVPGIKEERGDVILGGAVVVQQVMERAGCDALEVTEAGLREGVFFEGHLAGADPPLFDDVRRASVCNLARQYDFHRAHVNHVAALSCQMFDELGAAGAHPNDPHEREILWAAAMLHDIGTTVDYDDHHKHSRYLILSAGLPGYTQREISLIAQAARYHRKGSPSLGEFASLARDGDEQLLVRCSALLRLAEQLDRSRDQLVREAHVHTDNGDVQLELVADGDPGVARWAAERQADLFRRAFERDLSLAA
jgi:exopolyphosphatase / guanosine-5'-triphosphate,3'-diphosphate pyrophosphatase